MMTATDPYSRLVSVLKVALPLLALALLSMLFLIARAPDPERAIPYSEVDVENLSRDQRVAAPAFVGVTRDGAAISMVADTVEPRADDPDVLLAAVVSGELELGGGTSARVTAPSGTIDTRSDMARLLGGVVIVTTDGYTMNTESLDAALGETDVLAPGQVHAVGPEGTLDAGSMRITLGPDGGYQMDFNGGVRLVYDTPVRPEAP
jgi:lipopolysaccharide export system protein LptC